MSVFLNKNFKKKKYIDKDGYVLIRMPEDEDPIFAPMYNAKGYGYEHRIKMAKKLGRPLRNDEHVHHKDGNRKNNDIDNLELVEIRSHISDHIKKGNLKLFSKTYQPKYNLI